MRRIFCILFILNYLTISSSVSLRCTQTSQTEETELFTSEIGKRSMEFVKKDPYAFGLGKRSLFAIVPNKKDPFSLGLGKISPFVAGWSQDVLDRKISLQQLTESYQKSFIS